ncbi:MAG: DUF1501 domain-containing protein [Chloroflexi bacterium]|nr:DUF1501 domain-containing protein [Chloroflexota bacterium]
MVITRRQLLKGGISLLPALAFLSAPWRREILFASSALAATPADRTLVVVQQAGGNDGLNTIIPYSDGHYYDLRPNIAIPQEEVLPLNNEVGFHPELAKFKTLWDKGNLAIVEGVGYSLPSLSHFQSMDIWRFADPEVKVRQGWLGRYLETLGGSRGDVFPGLAVGRTLPLELYSPQVSVTIVESLSLYQFQGDSRYPDATQGRTEALSGIYDAAPQDSPYAALFHNTLGATHQSSAALMQADKAYQPGVDYPDSSLAGGLRILAEAITGNLGVRVGHVTIGGWDTHANQKPDHARLLRTLSEALYAFYQDLKAHGKDGDVLIMTWSEFGRRVTSNASDGTDHGTAVPVFFLGTPVKGGFYGQRPDLGSLSSNNLRFTTDFRTVYATVLEGWFKTPPDAILGKQFETLPIFNAGMPV